MAKVIAIGNNKGGIGKTTTATNLATGLARKGKRVLAIDNDPQGHLSKSLGVESPASLEYTLDDVMKNLVNDIDIEPGDGIIKTAEGVDLMPTNLKYSGMELVLFSAMNREQILKDYVTMMRPFYDYIIIDCQPTLGLLTVNAFTAADSILIPVTPEALPVDGLQQLFQTIGMIKKKLNPGLEIEGILFTIVDNRTRDAREVMQAVREAFENNVHFYEKVIPASVRAKECPATGYSIFEYDPKGTVANGYASLVEEVLENE